MIFFKKIPWAPQPMAGTFYPNVIVQVDYSHEYQALASQRDSEPLLPKANLINDKSV